jgi:hypothetical protein
MLAGCRVSEQRLQLLDVGRERVGARVIATQRPHRRLVAARGTAEPEVDAAGIERVERAELLGDHERRVIGQHDAAGADADRARSLRDEADRDRRRRAGDRRHVVVLGEPEAAKAELLGVPRELARPVQRGPRVAALRDLREVEH